MSLRTYPAFLSPAEIQIVASLGMTETHLWEAGRQGTGYERLNIRSLVDADLLYMSLASRALGLIGSPYHGHWDIWILRYPDGSYIPPHKDEATVYGLRHRRLNALVRAPRTGGEFTVGGHAVPLAVGDAVLFYPDEVEHAVSKVEGVRLVFSVGAWLEQSP